MPLSHDVSLPRAVKPVFPDVCVYCAAEGPGDTFTVKTHTLGWWTLLFWMGKRVDIEVPACELCARDMVIARRKRVAFELVLMTLAAIAAVIVLGAYRGPFRRWLAGGLALLLLTPWIVMRLLSPPPVDATVTRSTIDYEFRDVEYAAWFAVLNEASVE